MPGGVTLFAQCRTLAAALLLILFAVSAHGADRGLVVAFPESDDRLYTFSNAEKQLVEEVAGQSERDVRALLPGLPSGIRLVEHPISRDLAIVGGVTGRADDPRTVVVYVSIVHEGGVSAAINTGLAPVLYHEFHHLVRGWTIAGNQFGPGMTIAGINEGLANVFSETYTRTAFPGNAYPPDVQQWWQEIVRLPVTADYRHWMVEHDDGRQAIGYKAGSYIVRQALARSSYSILELSDMSIAEILALAGSEQ